MYGIYVEIKKNYNSATLFFIFSTNAQLFDGSAWCDYDVDQICAMIKGNIKGTN